MSITGFSCGFLLLGFVATFPVVVNGSGNDEVNEMLTEKYLKGFQEKGIERVVYRRDGRGFMIGYVEYDIDGKSLQLNLDEGTLANIIPKQGRLQVEDGEIVYYGKSYDCEGFYTPEYECTAKNAEDLIKTAFYSHSEMVKSKEESSYRIHHS